MKRILMCAVCTIVVTIHGSTVLKAQNNFAADTIRWNCSRMHNLNNGDNFIFNCVVKSYGLEKIEWIQKSGAQVFTFSITGVDGEWQDVTLPGRLALQISYEGNPGEMVFETDNAGKTTITYTLSGNDPLGIGYTFFVDNMAE
ncbi:MAG TPA: hypothetical protein VD816_09345 [Ohtaekwangia sp.]|nr:hypothetical protein [Ohtaekwangia sp.]